MRPPSIIWFERLFLGAVAVGLVNSAMVFDQLREIPGAQPLGPGFLIGSIAIGVVINLALWFFIARRASNGARWVLVVLFLFGAVSLIFSVSMGSYPSGTAGLLGAFGWLLQAAAVTMLFRRDAAAWFRGTRDDDLGETFE
ncbi:hypothetical protein COC42_01240 [Sphingomonas spermidinifaciens]|uniref:Uncharacterized protein n=1 Tax=Sphingomonas spermidinifaciens TaxID=1141889 RepID=A0A2A4B5Q2_9SPHN|nr:hypothetical protein [Sphingomonas spermidinifaciens]PCD03078.1 hypothetical protein COC42_01240 [Sphingomonas spermidinifaciens]